MLRRKKRKEAPDTKANTATKALGKRMFCPVAPPTVADLGLPEIEEPEAMEGVDPSFKQDMTRMGPRNLSRQHQYAVGMYAYVIACLAQVETKWAALKNARHRAAAELRILHHSGQQKYILDGRVDSNPDIQKLDKRIEIEEAKRILLKAQAEAYNSRVNLLSRELTRRKVEMEQRV